MINYNFIGIRMTFYCSQYIYWYNLRSLLLIKSLYLTTHIFFLPNTKFPIALVYLLLNTIITYEKKSFTAISQYFYYSDTYEIMETSFNAYQNFIYSRYYKINKKNRLVTCKIIHQNFFENHKKNNFLPKSFLSIFLTQFIHYYFN